MRRLWTAMLALLLLPAAARAQDRVGEIAATVDRHYNQLRSLAADFTESYRGAGMAREESGTLWLKRPGKMRWEYRLPREKLFVSDGKTAYFYVPGERQARKADAKKLDDLRSPLRYLLGKTKLQKEFDGLSLAPDQKPAAGNDIMLRGVPRAMADRVQQVLFEITPEGRIRRMVISETDGSVTEFRFSEERENINLSDDRFHFSPPPGVETIESSDLAP